MKLAIISHTNHYISDSGVVKGWGPTVREINFLASKFDHIIHLACLNDQPAPSSALPYTSSNIEFRPIPLSGGIGLHKKISGLMHAPEVWEKVKRVLGEVDAVQLRVPTGMANYLIPLLSVSGSRPLLWVKYAGNWMQINAPAGYRFQRWWLSRNYMNCRVTINGSWPSQPSHCYTFENPCLDQNERNTGKQVLSIKRYAAPYTACFVGRMEDEKGVGRILNALPEFAHMGIDTIHFIGDGKKLQEYQNDAGRQNKVNCFFHSGMSRETLVDFLIQSHFLLLPSVASEGFPKVIAEGANYGAIPIVSDVSSIGQYINNDNGYIWNTGSSFSDWLRELTFNESELLLKSKKAFEVAEAFTFDHYFHKLQKYILGDY